MTKLKPAIAIFLLITLCNPLFADRNLDGKKAEKTEIRHSMLGPRNTLLFYTFKNQQAILELTIDNKNESFPIEGRIHLFDKTTTEEGIKKWINNQHSDGLFPEVPEPIFTTELPEGSCKVTSHKRTGSSKNPGPAKGNFKDFEVKFSIKACDIEERFKLSAFTDTTQVHVGSE